jgi:hypothetical protein
METVFHGNLWFRHDFHGFRENMLSVQNSYSCMSSRYTGGVEVQLYSFLTSSLRDSEWSASRLGCFDPRVGLRYPLSWMLYGPLNRPSRFRNRTLISPPGNGKPACPAFSLITTDIHDKYHFDNLELHFLFPSFFLCINDAAFFVNVNYE